MSITWKCACGKTGKVADEKAGRKGKCPACGSVIHIPLAAPPPPPPPEEDTFELAEPEAPTKAARPTFVAPTVAPVAPTKSPRKPAAAPVPAAATFTPPPVVVIESSSKRGARDYLYLLLVLALIPLGVSLFRAEKDGLAERLERTLERHPEVASKVEAAASVEELFSVLPGHRFEGSLLARDTWWHWAFALISAAAFMAVMMFMFPPGHAVRTHLMWTGLFTATAGILVLLGFQLIANATDGVWVRGRGIVVLLFYVVKFIGFSYRAADDPSNGFLLSFFGFTLGVGFCEEVVKALPLIWHYRTKGTMGWRAACLWGFASGVGFGVAEGIIYSSRYYNGMGGGEIYLVRFVSCVALHATWAAAVGIFLWKHQNLVQDAEGIFGMIVNLGVIVSMPMVLHGAYDTLLKKDMNVWALAVAAVSFAWLAFQIESARRVDPDGDSAGTDDEEDKGLARYAARV